MSCLMMRIDQYKSELDTKLSNIMYDKDALQCKDTMCAKHVDDLCGLYNNVLKLCIEASKCIPATCPRSDAMPPGRRKVPGWSQEVEHLKKEALYWHKIWRSMGQPHQGDFMEMRRITRAQYHRAVRHTMNHGDKIRTTKMAEAISENRTRNLWSEVHRIKGRNKFSPSSIDGIVGDEEISQLFSDKYDHLYNSVPYDQDEMNKIKEEINVQIMDNSVYTICYDDVLKGVQHLKLGKSDGEEGLNSDHIINGPKILHVLLCLIFNSMLVHGASPDSMLVGTMVPIPKSKKQLVCTSDNFRAITLSSIVSKLFDAIILIKEQDALVTSDLQFGFKQKMSTTHCTYVMLETINHYNANGSNVYALMLDASKAFDRVNYCKLFRVLLERQMSPLVLRLLLYMYTRQKLQVKWNSCISPQFGACNGVKQGAILSPILFSVYMDGLFKRLENSGVGCHMGNHYTGGLGYADDLSLLTPSLSALRVLVKICEKYADEYDVKFNGAKSQYLVFKGRKCTPDNRTIVVGGVELKSVQSAMHLGHHISNNDKDSLVRDAIAKFWRSFNMFMADFGQIHSFVKCKLFKQYCCTYYGSPLWLFSSKKVDSICIAWRKALRKIWGLSPLTHCDILPVLSDCLPLEVSLKQRFMKFIMKAIDHKSPVISNVAKISLQNPWSNCGINYCNIMYEYHVLQ